MGEIKHKLNNQQLNFVVEYMVDLNGTQAAIRAGYSKNTADVQAARLLRNVRVAEELQRRMTKRSEKTEITAEYVLTTIRDTIEKCKEPETYDSKSVLKGCELLGKHLVLFSDKIVGEHKIGSDGTPFKWEVVVKKP